MYYIPDIIAQVTEATGTILNKDINFLFGSVNEVVTRLSQMSKKKESAELKYPLVALFTDIRERKGTQANVQCVATLPSIIIATFTDKNYSSEERKEKSFKPTLEPIYNTFMQELHGHTAVMSYSPELIVHDYYERYNWGRFAIFTENNLGSDFIDAIELINIELTINKKIC